MDSKKIAPGIVKYSSCFDVSDEEIAWLKNRIDESFLDNYQFVFGDGGELLYGINKSHHKIPAEHIFALPIRIYDDLQFDFVDRLEKAIYQALLEYVSEYQDVLRSIWWRTLGHFSAYPAGTSLDLHSDNDVNYRPKSVPKDQGAVQHVLSCTAVVNDNFEGGNMYFEYYGVEVEVKKGDILFFPSNYVGTHCVKSVKKGTRFSYVSWYGHGSPNPETNIMPEYPKDGQYVKGKVWMDHLYDEYERRLNSGEISGRRAFQRAWDH